MAAVDTAGAGTAFVSVANGGATNLRLEGGSVALNVPNISTSAAGAGILNLGASANNPQTVFVTDPTGVADQAYVDITKGTANGIALRLQGYGAGTLGATVSTNSALGNLQLSSGFSDSPPAVTIAPTTMTMTRPVTMSSPVAAAVGYTNVTSQSINNGADIGNTIYALANPAAIGVYNILVRVGDNVAININGQVNSVGFWNGTIWVCGGTNISPPVGSGNVVISFGANASRGTLYLQNTGSAQLQQVVVYMIPQLLGLGGVIV
jgi:hypothetical protein